MIFLLPDQCNEKPDKNLPVPYITDSHVPYITNTHDTYIVDTYDPYITNLYTRPVHYRYACPVYYKYVRPIHYRYVFLCHNHMYYDLYNTKKAVIACCICWIIAAIMDSANLVGWGDHSFDQKSHRYMYVGKQIIASKEYDFNHIIDVTCFYLSLKSIKN